VKKWLRILLIVVAIIIVLGVVMFFAMRSFGRDLVRHPLDAPTRRMTDTPDRCGLAYEDVTVTTEDGLNLVGWFFPSRNGAVVITQHGYTGTRQNMLYDARLLNQAGYGVLVSTIRAHDESDGELMTFGKEEMKDLEAWYQYLLTREDIDTDKIGAFGESMGGMLVVMYAADNPNIKAVVTHSAFSSLEDTAAKGVEHFTGLPAFPFAPMIIFWAEREAGFDSSEIDTTQYIARLSPRPVYIMMGGNDDTISNDSGQWLKDAAGDPKYYWCEPTAGHHGLPEIAPCKYDQCVVAFYDRYLLGQEDVDLSSCETAPGSLCTEED
jgi:dienelactone hydrolase